MVCKAFRALSSTMKWEDKEEVRDTKTSHGNKLFVAIPSSLNFSIARDRRE